MKKTVPMPFDVRLMHLTARLLLVAFVLMAGVAGVSWVVRHPVFAIRTVTVMGDVEHSNALTLRANVTPRLSGTFLTLDLAAAREAFEAVPWVRRAVVQRVFPDRLKVVLQEHQAVAYWNAEGDSTLVNSFGEVFEANVGEVEQEALPRLSGPQGQAPAVLAVYQALQPMFGRLDLVIEQLELTGRGGWRAQLDSGAVIELGRGEQDEVVERSRRFLATLPQVTSRYGRTATTLESADLRHQDGYAIRLRGVSTLLATDGKKQ